LQQHLLFDWFRQKSRAPRRQTHFSIPLKGRGRQCDDRRGRPVVRLAPFRQENQSILSKIVALTPRKLTSNSRKTRQPQIK